MQMDFFEILRVFLSKVEVIFSILEVNFEILVEVICPASKSQSWDDWDLRSGDLWAWDLLS